MNMFRRPKSKIAAFQADGIVYECMVSYYPTSALAHYKLAVHRCSDLLLLDSDFQRLQDATGLDIYFHFDDIVQTEQFQQMVINSSWWDYGYFDYNDEPEFVRRFHLNYF